MINPIADRIRSIQTTVTRATVPPLLVRCAIFLSALVAFALAYPLEIFAGRGLALLLIAAALPAVAPRRAWPTVAVLVAVVGWLLSTTWYDEPVALSRLLGLAACLYLTHSLSALAAALPYDAVVAPEVLAGWISRALGVVLASAVLAILLLDFAGQDGDRTLLVAVLGGLVVAVGAAGLLAWLLRRR